MAFVDKLSETMSQFADRIQDKDYQGCMEEALAFEKQALKIIENYILAQGRDKDRQRIFTTQEFLRKYNKYLSHLPEDLDKIGEVDRLRLQHIVEQARNSGIPELVEWSNHPDNLAENLAQLQLQNHAST